MGLSRRGGISRGVLRMADNQERESDDYDSLWKGLIEQ